MAIKTDHSYNTEWVIEQLEHVAQFGLDESGVTRLAFSAADHQARQYIVELMKNIGLTVQTDAIGNIIGRYQLEVSQSELAAVVTGSHLDTVPGGGKYDGVLGVLCGLAAVKDLSTRTDIKHPLEVVVFAAEESSRFNFATMGSKAMAGLANLSSWRRAEDQQGITLAAELMAIGLDIEQIGSAVRSENSIKGFIELHIDQGQILEQDRICIGIVDKVSSPTKLKITVTGMAGHSAGTPISQRQDALVSAAMIVLAVRDIAVEYDYQGTVATVTILNTYPSVINVIPGTVEMWVDIRG
ncbi:MAG: Zn-dependent hydrolase, partial [Sporomusa sp.]